MAQLTILEYPDPRLHKIAAPVVRFDERLKQVAADMAETMYAAPGVGLAASQVDVHERLVVIDTSESKDQLRVFVNPELIWVSEEKLGCEEACLSVPGVYEEVTRSTHIRVKAQDADGEFFELDCEGLLAICVQHEMDHLVGKVFVEYLSPLKQQRIKTKIRKRRAQAA